MVIGSIFTNLKKISVMSNPWETEPSFVNIGGLSNIIKVNKNVSNIDSSIGYHRKWSNDSLIEFIDHLKELAELNKEQANVSFDYQIQNLASEYHSILNTTLLDGLISMLDYMTNHLQLIIDNKQILIDRLQKPYVGDFLPIDCSYHALVDTFFPKIADQLANVTSVLNNFELVNKFQLRNTELTNSLDMLLRDLSLLQNLFQGIGDCRQVLNQLYQKRLVMN